MKRNLILLCTWLCMSMAAHAVLVWDGTSAPWTNGSGTEADPYLIETPQQLAFLSDMVGNDDCLGKHFVQKENFDMGGYPFTPIGISPTHPFRGIYDGSNNSISNLMIDGKDGYIALFGCLVGGMVKNLTIDGTFASTTSGLCAAGIVGLGENVSLVNCKNMADIDKLGQTMAGIIAHIQGICMFDGCSNTAKVEYSKSGSNSDMAGVGGIVGGNDGDCTLTNCSNVGEIVSKGTSAGGIIGFNNYTNTNCVVSNCSNAGVISSDGIAGGIIGYNAGMNQYNTVNSTVMNCYNTGEIITSGDSKVGGIVGSNYNSTCTIKNCFNTGSVSAPLLDNVGFRTYSKACGIVVDSYGVCKISNCYARCSVKGANAYGITMYGNAVNSYFAGILSGYSNSYGIGDATTITNCYFNSDCGASSTYSKGTPLTTDQLKSDSMPLLLNASSEQVWTMDTSNLNEGYPILGWQITYKITGNCDLTYGVVNGSGSYAAGTIVQLTAIPNKDCLFIGWSDGDKTNPRSITVGTADVTYTALFVKMHYTITIGQDCSTTVQ